MPGVFPPLGGSGFVTGEPGRLVNILLRGISGSLTVGGKEYSSTMPPFASKLSDAEIAAVATHIRGNFGNKAGDPITADFVKEQRANAPNVPYAGDKDLQEHP
jgi:mono/diheme cytochrome c family protein